MLLFHLHHNYCGEDGERSQARDMRPSITGQPHRLQISTSADRQVIASPPRRPHQYFLPDPQGALPKPPIPLACASRFLDWFHLFNDGCANDPSHVVDGVIDTRTCQEWGLDWDLEREGRVLLKRAGWSLYVCVYVWTAEALVFVFPKQTRTLDAEWKLETTPWRNFSTVAQMKRDLSTSHHSLMAVSSAQVDISFLKRLCDSCGERNGYTEDTIWDFFFPFFCNRSWGTKKAL